MGKLRAILKLTRIEHSIMLVIAVIAAEIISGGLPALGILFLSIITPIFISMGSFAINDYYDVKADRANKRNDRPLVNGALSRKEAMQVSIASFAVGVLASLFINPYAFIIALAFAALAVLYSYRLKDMLMVGTIYIAFSMAIPFIYGNYVVASKLNISIVLISILIFLAGMAREIHGMLRDYKGDSKARKSKNILHHMGARRSSQFAALLYSEAMLVSVYLFFFIAPFAFNLVYAVPIAITDIVLAYVSYGYIMQKKSDKFYSFSRNASLAAMALALISFLAAALVYIHI